MRLCLTEIMKELNEVTRSKDLITSEISASSKIKYFEGEEVDKSFDFDSKLKELNELVNKEMNYKFILTNYNAKTNLIGYKEKLTISEGLIKLAILSKKLNFYKNFQSRKQIEKRLIRASFQGDVDRVEVVEKLYDISKIDEYVKETSKEISKLQVAIDKTNLLTEVEV